MEHFQVHAAMHDAEYTSKLEKTAIADRIRMMRDFVDRALAAAPTAKKPKLLDVGCADGGICAPFKDRAELHGLDVNATFLEGAAQNGMRALAVDFEKERFPHEDGSVDILVCGETIEHVVNTDWFMCEINRVVKPGGRAVFSIPNVNQLISLPMMAIFDLPPRYSARFRAPHVRDFTFRSMRGCFDAFGFHIRERAGTGVFVPSFSRHLFRGASRRFPRFSAEIVFLLEKRKDVAFDPAKTVTI